jgi:hypothetical protein
MKVLRALRSGSQLCHSHFLLLWVETAWRSATLLLCLTFSLLGAFVFLDRATVGPGWQVSEDVVALGILKIVCGALFRRPRLALQITLLVVAFCVFVWLLLASFFQGSILAALKRKEGGGAAPHNRWGGVYRFFQGGWRFWPSLLAINLVILFFSFAGLVASLLMLSSVLKPIVSARGLPSRWWVLCCPLAIAVVCLIVAMAQQCLELCKFYVTQYHCSPWGAWNRSAEFFFPNLGAMSAISTMVRGLQFVCAAVATVFFCQIAFAVGSRFPRLLLSLGAAVYFGYGIVRSYLALVQSGSLLALIADDKL